MSYVSFIAGRYLRSGRNDGFFSFITAIATLGVMLGTATLIVALSVLGGFERDITEKVVGFTSHVQVLGFQNQPLTHYEENTWLMERKIPSVRSVAPFVAREALIRSREGVDGILLKGIDTLRDNSTTRRYLVAGRYDLDREKGGIAKLVLGKKLAAKLAVGVGENQRRAGRHHRRLGEARAFARAHGTGDPFVRRRLAARRREAAQLRAIAVAEETLAGEGLRHHAVDRLAAMHEPDQRAPGRQAGDEALGAVDRVEHPDIFRLGPVLPIFFADNAVGGESLRDQPPHRRLGAAVGLRDGIEHAAARLVLGADGRTEEGNEPYPDIVGTDRR